MNESVAEQFVRSYNIGCQYTIYVWLSLHVW